MRSTKKILNNKPFAKEITFRSAYFVYVLCGYILLIILVPGSLLSSSSYFVWVGGKGWVGGAT